MDQNVLLCQAFKNAQPMPEEINSMRQALLPFRGFCCLESLPFWGAEPPAFRPGRKRSARNVNRRGGVFGKYLPFFSLL
jgi:hypothetical protein